MQGNAEIVQIKSSDDAALTALVLSRTGRSQLELVQMGTDALKDLRRDDYAAAVSSQSLQLVINAIHTFGSPIGERVIWQQDVYGYEICASCFNDGSVLVTSNGRPVVDNRTPGAEKFKFGGWLIEVAKFLRNSEIQREAERIVNETKRRTELILDLAEDA